MGSSGVERSKHRLLTKAVTSWKTPGPASLLDLLHILGSANSGALELSSCAIC